MVTENTFKQLPYGNTNFESIITRNYAFIDKTKFIELLEKESNTNQFFIRPRKFGKSLFFSMLSCYYDQLRAEQFQELFGGLYIGKNPTPRKNSYAVMEFDFSGIDTTSPENFIKSFVQNVQRTDVYLKRSPLLPEVKYEWIFELKYFKASKKPTDADRRDARKQLQKYTGSYEMKDRNDLKKVVILFVGKNKYELFEN